MHRTELDHFFNDLLTPANFQDYCPNGLQVEGTDKLQKIAFAVSATRESITQAAKLGADALVVHHGLFWHFHGARTLTGAFAKRITPLVQHNINLFAYHLPLDAHPEVGNAAVLGQLIGCQQQSPFGNYKGNATGIEGLLEQRLTAKELASKLQSVLNHDVIIASPDENQIIESVGIITGGANSDWVLAQKAGLDAYITGEISEHDWHESQESGIHMFAGGHYATEIFGVLALMQKIQVHCGLECIFIDSDNPA
ncbi:MAG: Nif3-like dinuclear metal center hexameric protein [Gammaproteobacteria bacterium]|jgi:dinuclear metal center YbgI/SA1388 family protein|nr:Nif3-like dinuclear metal center hexameric protein [Gammaproteobacteria bacterium]MBT4146780.1 Nif3-like dinuclear metal center hexameric protein [Gammaproteobacteria bacterium]MBT5222693.1 Nif3-like dinuclear metal center hexameric protein [Gammaproteobacteria bacterium]MBT5825721.1 Nif3-like dinuclear metal center hexameric protein [Gammaproteobacteria bacterium]MBT5966494.1 Nif3-like dinuclear metal center hexameric protein [Gammaproteobacteria bacterium]